MWKPLRIPVFRRLLAAYTTDALGTWLGEIALAVLVLRETHSAAAVAAVWVAGQFVASLVAPFVVARLDRASGRSVLPGLFAGEALLFAVLAACAPALPLPMLLAIAAIDGTLAIAARALLKAGVVAAARPAGLLREGNALLIGSFTIAAALGPLLGGIVVTSVSVQAALAADAVSFAVAALVLGIGVEVPRNADDDEQTQGRAIRAALRHIGSRGTLRDLVVAFAGVCVFGAAILPLEVVLVTDTLGGSEAAYGGVLAAWGAGSIAGSLLLPPLRRLSMEVLTVAGFVGLALSYAGMGTASTVGIVVAFSVIGGVANAIEGYALVTAIQERTADAYQARVGGLVEALGAGASGSGYLLGGLVASAVSVRAAYLVAGAGIVLAAVQLCLAMTARTAPSLPDAALAEPATT